MQTLSLICIALSAICFISVITLKNPEAKAENNQQCYYNMKVINQNNGLDYKFKSKSIELARSGLYGYDDNNNEYYIMSGIVFSEKVCK